MVPEVAAGTKLSAKHYRIENFLSGPERAQLLEFVRNNEHELVASTVYPPNESVGREDHETRRSRTLFGVEGIWPPFESRLEPLLPHIRKELDTGWFELDGIERQLTIHCEGDFFTRHSDAGAFNDRRAVTFVYYFNCEPKSFEGGELRLYDFEEREGVYDAADSYTTIQPVDNSIVFFPSWFQHEVTPVRSRAPGLEGARFTVNGWFLSVPHRLKEQEGGKGVRLAPAVPQIDPRRLPTLQQKLLPTFTAKGFEVLETPADVHELLTAEFERGRQQTVKEKADPVYQRGGDPDFAAVECGTEVLERLREVHEQWAGVELVPRAAYGFRIYRRGQSLRRHCDRPETHVISSIVHVAAELDEPWPVTIEDHRRRSHDVVLEPGQMVLYESATCPHARRKPLAGDFYTSLFLHYQPAQGWDWDVEKLYAAAEQAGLSTQSTWFDSAVLEARSLLTPVTTRVQRSIGSRLPLRRPSRDSRG